MSGEASHGQRDGDFERESDSPGRAASRRVPRAASRRPDRGARRGLEFLLKDTPPAELLAAIRIIASGDALLAPSVTRKLIREFARQSPASPRPSLDVLTDREQDVLALVARGLSNAEIAAELFISLATVKTHVSRLLTKLAARDRAQLIVVAYESGFVTKSPDQ